MDFGAKDNIFRSLVKAGAQVTVVPAQTSLEDVLALKPDGVFLSNGPGDPAATGAYAVPVIQGLLERDMPIFGICLGHQMLGAGGGRQDHQDAPGPPRREPPGQAAGGRRGRDHLMNHGFAVDDATLPDSVEETHVSLFDGSNCGIAVKGKRAFGVQYHPEAVAGAEGQLLSVRALRGDVEMSLTDLEAHVLAYYARRTARSDFNMVGALVCPHAELMMMHRRQDPASACASSARRRDADQAGRRRPSSTT